MADITSKKFILPKKQVVETTPPQIIPDVNEWDSWVWYHQNIQDEPDCANQTIQFDSNLPKILYVMACDKYSHINMENVKYLGRMPFGSEILIGNKWFLRLEDDPSGHGNENSMVDMSSGQIKHCSRITPPDILIRDGSRLTINTLPGWANDDIIHDVTSEYFTQVNLLNSVMSHDTFDNVIQMMPVSKLDDAKVLDVGCGTGETISYIYKNFSVHSIDGVDANTDRLNIAKHRFDNQTTKVSLVNEDIDLFTDNSKLLHKYDVIFCFGILEHLLNPMEVFDKLKLLLADGGSIIGTIPHTPFVSTSELKKRLDIVTYPEIDLRFSDIDLFLHLNI